MRWKVDHVDPDLRERAESAAHSDDPTPDATIEEAAPAGGQDRDGAPRGADAAADVLTAIAALEARLEQRTTQLEHITDLALHGGRSDDRSARPTARPSAADTGRDAPAPEDATPEDAAPDGDDGQGNAGEPGTVRLVQPTADRDEVECLADAAREPGSPEPGSPAETRDAETPSPHRRRWLARAVAAGAVVAVIGPLAILIRLGLEPPPAPGQPGTGLGAVAREAAGDAPGPRAEGAPGGADGAPAFPIPDKPDVAVPPHLVAKAEAGDAAAQFELGELMYTGRQGTTDRKRGIAWIEAAAIKGHAEAQFRLAGLIAGGIGFKRNPKEAVFWYLSAAESGHTEAQFALAEAYAAGRGTERNASEAARWYRTAAEKGHAEAAYRLGRMFELGEGVRKDRSEALEWYTRAKGQGSGAAAEKVAQLTALPAGISPAPEPPIAPGPAAPGKRLGRAELRELQYLLKSLAFDPGPVDGRLGRKTREAVRLYQRFAGLPETGEPGLALLRDLRAVARTSGSTP